MPPSLRSPCDGCRDALVRELRTQLDEATATACRAYEDNVRLVRVLSIIAKPSAPDVLNNEVLTALSQTYNADIACLVRLVGGRLIMLSACGVAEDDAAYSEGWPAGPASVRALESGQVVSHGHPQLLDPEDVPPALAALGIRSAAWVPIPSRRSSDGELLLVFRRSSDGFSPADLGVLASVAFRLGVAVEARERGVLAERLARSGHRLTRHLNLTSLFHEAVALLRDLLGASTARIITVTAGAATQACPPPALEGDLNTWPRPAGDLPGWLTLSTGVAYHQDSFLGLPIMGDGRPMAVLYAERDAGHPFLRDEVEAATTFAYYLRSAMVNAELYQALRRSEATLRHRASHDPLTGLANRDLASRRLETALNRDDPGLVGLLFCDLDKFKDINDRLGHNIGDDLLRLVAERLRRCLRRGDLLARLGGDEFVFILDGVRGLGDVTDIGNRVTAIMEQPFTLHGEAIRMTVSVGGVCGTRGLTSPIAMLRDADAAMYGAKGRGRGLVEVFDEDASLRSLDQLDIRSDLQCALDRHQLLVHYQPVFDLPGGDILGFEALLRWNHPLRGPIPPDVFIPIAEETGAIVPIGAWVLREACRQLAMWQALPGWRTLDMSVNLSAVQMRDPEVATGLVALIRESGVDPATVWLEVTEHSAVQADVDDFVTPLRRAGVHFALDDFGISYSNLSYLRRFPAACLKIDRSFVFGLTEGDQPDIDRGVVRAILAIADSLNIIVVAEGIESTRQRAELADLGCHRGQGYLLSGALPPAEATRLLISGPHLPSTRCSAK